ncbi:MAG: hypothetical protein KIT72_00995 [Polyangiaceae bacterium]|nr:hypothetical protein [Polyangiaceae bacterium]MCW5788972.1 hypothetical protein [Polyangiaceae bacterium]
MYPIQIERRVIAPGAAVWRALSSRTGLALWQADEVRGSVARGEVVTLAWPQLGAELHLEVAELVPGRRITLQDPSSKLILELVTGGVRLTHELVIPPDDVEGMHASWRLALSQLAHSLERHPGCVRHSEWASCSLPVSAAQIHSLVTVPELAARWLWTGRLGDEGSHAELTYGGRAVSGRVLCHTPGRDVSVCWEEHGASTLTVRTLPSPVSNDERLVALVWSRWHPVLADASHIREEGRALRSELEGSITRLTRLVQQTGRA